MNKILKHILLSGLLLASINFGGTVMAESDEVTVPAPDVLLVGGEGLELIGGLVATWNNLSQPGSFDAVQNDASKRPAIMYEVFPGHEVVRFDGANDIMGLVNTADNPTFSGELTIFYVGRTLAGGSFSGSGGFLGNFQTGSNFKNGWSLRTDSSGGFDYLVGNDLWNITDGGVTALGDKFVLLNSRYSMNDDGSGLMELFSSLVEGVNTTRTSRFNLSPSSLDISLGAFSGFNSKTFDQHVACDVAEVRIYGSALSDEQREVVWAELSTKYNLFYEEASALASFEPTSDEAPVDTPITISFTIPMNLESMDNVIVGARGLDGLPEGSDWSRVSGSWSASDDSMTFTFTADTDYEAGELIMCEIPNTVLSAAGNRYRTSTRETFSFVIDTGLNYLVTETTVESMDTVFHDNGDPHNLPMIITVPHTDEPCPVVLWVHGGGWSGSNSGTRDRSAVGAGMMVDYFTKKLGIAVVGVAWRSQSNSEGTFTKVVEDVTLAVQHVIDNADVYGIDPSRMGLYGGSAGTPTSALVSQRIPNINCYIGFNGLYNFSRRSGGSFGGGNGFGQMLPSGNANSAALNIRTLSPPDTLLLHGSVDTTIEHEQSDWYAEAIEAAGGNGLSLIYRDEVHAFFNPGRDMHYPTMYASAKHMNRVFGLTQQVESTPYQDWSETSFSEATEGTDITALGDPDEDGFTNEMEWAMNTNPLTVDTLTADVVKDDSEVKLTYYRRDPEVTGFDVYASWSRTLEDDSWALSGIEMTETSMGSVDGVETIVVSLPLSEEKAFIRVNVDKR